MKYRSIADYIAKAMKERFKEGKYHEDFLVSVTNGDDAGMALAVIHPHGTDGDTADFLIHSNGKEALYDPIGLPEHMSFEMALKLMKEGEKVKLPSWGGYWYWDPEKETIMMQCRPQDTDQGQGPLLDIRETQRVEYTISNILSDEWQLATEGNTPVLGGVATFSFGDAIKYMKRGMRVKRQGWNGKNQYIELASNISYQNAAGDIVNSDHDVIGNKAIAFVGTSGVQMGWLASQADMLAEDWVFAD